MRTAIRIVLALLTVGVLWLRAPELRAVLSLVTGSRAGICTTPRR